MAKVSNIDSNGVMPWVEQGESRKDRLAKTLVLAAAGQSPRN